MVDIHEFGSGDPTGAQAVVSNDSAPTREGDEETDTQPPHTVVVSAIIGIALSTIILFTILGKQFWSRN